MQIAHTEEKSIQIAIAWCLAWGGDRLPQHPEVIQQMRDAVRGDQALPDSARPFLAQAQQLGELEFPETAAALKEITEKHEDLWNAKIGLIYGGATKIKQYVFEAAKLPDIRGASALLDRINLFDIPAFFGKERSVSIEQWLDKPKNFPSLQAALIPELIIYSTGGNVLAFCPVAYVDMLADAIEKRYTEETLTANSCAVGSTFHLLETKLGLLKDPIEQTFWIDQYRANPNNPIVKSYFDQEGITDIEEKFRNRKNFTELVTYLTGQYNQRRNGYDLPGGNRPSRRYPAMFETHPYLRRDGGDRRLAVAQVAELGDRPWLSESLIRKRVIGQLAKQQDQTSLPRWFTNLNLEWQPTGYRIPSWVEKFKEFLDQPTNQSLKTRYYKPNGAAEPAQTLREIGNISKTQGFVAYIYADGNNMGSYIQKEINTPKEYQQFSADIFNALQFSVFLALAEHLQVRELKGLNDPDNIDRNGNWIHPFEIVTIGGDDVLLIVPADVALSIAKTIGDAFGSYLIGIQLGENNSIYLADKAYDSKSVHRYQSPKNPTDDQQCTLSVSIGVLVTAEDTPIYYANKLVDQLLKSAKKRAKELRQKNYLGGTIDFLTLKSVTMLSDKIEAFRKEGLTKEIRIKNRSQILKLYAAPYTLHEIGGLIDTVKALKKSDFPRSQLYQIRSLLERGKHTAILNYRYFRVRLKPENQRLLKQWFEETWCEAKTNDGNIAPWIYFKTIEGTQEHTGYETIWRDLVDLYSFIEEPQENDHRFDVLIEAAKVKP